MKPGSELAFIDYMSLMSTGREEPTLRSEHDPPDEWDIAFMQTGYSYCRPCGEYHRPPECVIEGELVNDAGTGSALEVRSVPEVRGEEV